MSDPDHPSSGEPPPSAETSAYLLRAVERFARGLRHDRVYQEVVDLIVPELAEMAAVRVREPDGSLRVLAAAPPGTLGSLEGTQRSPALTASYHPSNPAYRAIESGETYVVDDFDGWLAEHAPNPEYRAHVGALGVKRAAFFPLRSHGQTVGLLSAAFTREDGRFDSARLQLLEALGRHAALAMENARLLEEAEALRHVAEQANLSKDQFLATVSHELRNPLSAILGWVRLLRARSPRSEQLDRGLEVIERSALAQASLIEDLLDVSRIVAGTLKLEPRATLLPQLVEGALESVRPLAEAKGVRLVSSIAPGVSAGVVDPGRLQQVIWNLLSNAVKFTPAGGQVELRCRREGGELELTVVDTGEGMDAAFVPHAFERFRQAEPAARQAGGLGLGLAIVRHIVELHGGGVRAESDGVGRGSRFIVRIPLREEEAGLSSA